MFTAIGKREANLYLVSPAALMIRERVGEKCDEPWLQRWGEELARKMRVPCPQVELGAGTRLDWLNRIWAPPVHRWAMIERAGYRIRLHPNALQNPCRLALLFVVAHMLGELNSNEPEWVQDLRAWDTLDEMSVPLNGVTINDATAMEIAVVPRARLRALEFRSGKRVVDRGDQLTAEYGARAYEAPFMVQAWPYRPSVGSR